MKLLMDADCLLKITKAGLKELVCQQDAVVIPDIVRKEVVDAGKVKGLADAFAVEKNISMGLVTVATHASTYTMGDDALADLFPGKGYDAIATDDTKLTRRLGMLGIPFILPSLIIYRFLRDGCIDKKTAVRALDKLAGFISNDEFSTARLLMGRIP